jgi:Chitobiase/beta-hexosaminidase C-terminal domain
MNAYRCDKTNERKGRNVLKSIHLKSLLKIAPACLIWSMSTTHSDAFTDPSRTVIQSEVGDLFANAVDFPWSEIGADDGHPASRFSSRALKIHYAKFHIVKPSDQANFGFPYTKLRAYEASEVKAGRPRIFVTATYAGKRRPVLFAWSLGLSNGHPTTSSNNWSYVVNVSDRRYINFWLNDWLRPVMWKPYSSVPNLWFHLDQCAFDKNIYGVLDDSNHFVAGVKWDSPFPQTFSAYTSSINTFFSTLKSLAPDLKFMPNVASMTYPSLISTTFANAAGVMHETLTSLLRTASSSSTREWIKNQFYTQDLAIVKWLGSLNRPQLMRDYVDHGNSTQLRTSFVMYSLFKGHNGFFAPTYTGTITLVNPSLWQPMASRIGYPVAALQSTQYGTNIGDRLFSRHYSNGYVYLNWTQSTRTVTLPAGTYWLNPSGSHVTAISIPVMTGTYVYKSGTSALVAAVPAISPRTSSNITGPVSVTMAHSDPNAIIRYTVDGTSPTSDSAVYTGPVQVENSTVVQARAFVEGSDPSSTSAAAYQVTTGAPTLEFATVSDAGAAGTHTSYPVLGLSAVPDQAVTVSYEVEQPDGRSTQGTVTFAPGEVYQAFPVQVSGSGTARVTIENATGAVIGPANTFEYSLE